MRATVPVEVRVPRTSHLRRAGIVIAAGVVCAPASVVVAWAGHVRGGAFAGGACVSFRPLGRPNGHSVFLDPGHGGLDPGASGRTRGGRVVEKELTLAVALDASRLLRADGFGVTISRVTDTTVSRIAPRDRRGGALTVAADQRDLRARIRCANDSRAQILLGIHFDAFADRRVGGAETIYSPSRNFAAESRQLAVLVQHALVTRMRAAGQYVPDRGIRSDAGQGRAALSAWQRRYGHLLELGPAWRPRFRDPTRMPGVIAEPLFISNPGEAAFAAGARGQSTIAVALATAVEEYFDVRRAHQRLRAAAVAAPPQVDRLRGKPPGALPRKAQQSPDRFIRLGLPLYCGGARRRDVALTFDDGPGPATNRTLRLLRRYGESATFFLVGRNLAEWPGLAREEASLGAVGDHTWTHPFLTRLGAAAVEREIAPTQRALERLTGRAVLLFRPPYGFHDRTVDRVVRRRGMLQVLWSLDSRDSYPPPGASAVEIVRTLARSLRPGSIVLLHENLPETQLALPTLLRDLRSKGLRSVSVPELLALDPPTVAQLRRGIHGCPGERT